MSQIRLEKWKIFDSLSDQVKRSIRLARVIPQNFSLARENQSPPTSAIYVTAEDEVFGFGQNLNGFLGTGDTIPHPTPTRIDVLCGKNIQGLEISHSGKSIFAISSLGSVFAWGENNNGQLGLGTNQQTIIPTKISGILEGKKVVQVACGESHTLALTSEGQVFAFGYNQFGQLGRASNAITQVLPAIVGGPLAGRFVTAIACQVFSSIALLDSGEVFACGLNANGKLAITTTNFTQNIPRKVCGLEEVTISKLACGNGHTLALSTDGKIYAWGVNGYGQVGTIDTETTVSVPTLISSEIDRVKDVAALYFKSAALTVSNQIYIWGKHGEEIILRRPTITSLSSLDEVFAPETFRPLRRKDCPTGKDMKTSLHNYCWLKQAFNDSDTADFAFVVEGKKIHVHKSILILRCVVFKTMFLGDWKESHENEHTIEGRSFDAFFAFLKYFYTDELDVQPETALECLCLAHFYQMNELQVECERLIKSGVTVENAALIYDKALLIGSKELKAFVFDFCLKNLTAVVKSDNFQKLSEQVARDIFRRAAEQGGFKN